MAKIQAYLVKRKHGVWYLYYTDAEGKYKGRSLRSEPQRHDRHFIIIALAYTFLCAFGAAAETLGIAQRLKANTRAERVLNLARIRNYFYFLQLFDYGIKQAMIALKELPT